MKMPLELQGLRFSLESLTPGRVTSWHEHGKARLCALIDGHVGEDRPRSREESWGRGVIVYRPGDIRHRNRYGSRGAHIVRVEMEARWLDALGLGRELSQPGTLQSETARDWAWRLREELTHPDIGSELVLEAVTLEIVAELARSKSRDRCAPPSWLSRITEKLSEEIDRPHRLQDLAREAGVHPAQIARQFRTHFGISVGGYLRKLRVDFARHQLVESVRPLGEIAQSAGFSDQSHFTNVFRRATGITPGEYRRRFSRRSSKNARSFQDRFPFS